MGATAAKELRGRGGLRLFGSTGSNYVSHRAAASVTGSYDISWPGAAPPGSRFLQIDAAGDITYATGAGGSLDDAYDNGGAGAGRIITADSGPLEVSGTGGIQVTHTDPFHLFETTGVGDYNWRIQATSGNLLNFERGDQDADVSDDTFDTIMTIDGVNQWVGILNTAPAGPLDVQSPSGDLETYFGAPTNQDAIIVFQENSVDAANIRHDASASQLTLGMGAGGAIIKIGTSQDAKIGGDANIDARLHVEDANVGSGGLVALIENTSANGRLSLRGNTTTNNTQVYIQAAGNDCQLGAGGSTLLHLDGADGRVGIGDTTPSAKLDVFNNVASQITLFLNIDSTTGRGLVIDSEATSQPLIELDMVNGNSRGDIAFDTVRTSDPGSATAGDLWYHGTDALLRYKAGTKTLNVGTNTYEQLADPGDAATFNVPDNSNFEITLTNSTGSQTRTIGTPAYVGQRGIIVAAFSGAGTATALDGSGAGGFLGGGTADDVANFDTTGETIEVVATDASEWRACYYDSGVTFS